MKTAFLTGFSGQLGSFLAEFLLKKNYKVIGLVRRSSNPDYSNIVNIIDNENVTLEEGDMCDSSSLFRIIEHYKPDECYNLAAMSHVHSSWEQPITTFDINTTGVIRLLEAIRLFSPKTKFYHSSTSEVYGDVQEVPQTMDTLVRVRSPYGASKSSAEEIIKVYKESYNLFACYSRNFNFEGPRRGKNFVTRKITEWIGKSWNIVDKNIDKMLNNYGMISTEDAFKIALEKNLIHKLHLGNIFSKRDWQHYSDVIRGIWSMLQQDKCDNFIFASGEAHSVEEFIKVAFESIGIKNYMDFIYIDPKFFRPAEVDILQGDYSKAEKILGWKPSVKFEDIVKEMVNHDIEINNVQ